MGVALRLVLWMMVAVLQAGEPPVYERPENAMPDYRYVIDKVIRVVDGDTVDVSLDMGFQISYWIRVRLHGVNTPEKRGYEAPYGNAVTGWVTRWVAAQQGKPLYLKSIEWDKYGGRVLGDLQTADGRSLATILVAAGMGKAYQGDKKEHWTRDELDRAKAAAEGPVDKP